ncbi:MAG: molybdopterin oxidoreductase family protein [Betaproteobacteria bacterium]|nr:molybdopterin oxidoreductase family protein [Betaproteobacteria bacterium]
MTQTLTVRGACPHDCPDTCALLTTVEDGRAVKVHGNPAHPHTDGVLCAKVSRYTERTYHPDRLLHPMKRVGPKGSGQFARISWDEALDTVASRLSAISACDPQAIQPYSYAGTMGLVQGESMDRRFFHQLGASLLDRTICASAGGEALTQTIGGKLGMRVEFFAEAKLILIWGSNSIGSNLHFWRYAMAAKRAGARLVCIDPRKSETADKCHEHIALMPGTDAALALALMHELIVNRWLDQDYIDSHTIGFGNLCERALLWNPERAAAVCGINADQIRRLAHDYGTTQPAAIRLNYGMQRVHGGGNAARAIACLPALTGAWRYRAGGLLLSTSATVPAQRSALQRRDLLGQGEARSNAQIFRDLGARMGFRDPCFADDDEALCRQAFAPASGVDFDALLRDGFAHPAVPEAPFAQGGFATPSGRCEFFSQRLADQGLDGLPDHVPNHEGAGSSSSYPLAMISPPARNFLNSSFVNVTSLRNIEGEPLLEIHPTDAAVRGVTSGQVVRVFNDRGSYHCKAEVSERARPGVVNGLGIWWRKMGLNGTNVNELTSQALTDMGRGPTFYDCLVEVQVENPACAA